MQKSIKSPNRLVTYHNSYVPLREGSDLMVSASLRLTDAEADKLEGLFRNRDWRGFNTYGQISKDLGFKSGSLSNYLDEQFVWMRDIHEIIPKNTPAMVSMVYGSDGKDKGYIMEHINGRQLNAIAQWHAPLISYDERVELAIQLISILSTLHINDMPHCDLYPFNITVDSDGRAILLDADVQKGEVPIIRAGGLKNLKEYDAECLVNMLIGMGLTNETLKEIIPKYASKELSEMMLGCYPERFKD